jgi:hypothetical protein
MKDDKIRFNSIFTTAYLFTVTMLFILQISEIPCFFLWLVLMHGGIVVLAVSKKRFKHLGVKDYYQKAYMSFAFFIPILINKIIVAIFSLEENEQVVTIISFIIIAGCLALAIFNFLRFFKNNKA